MAKTLLRSGNLDAVLPLGENGMPVYLSALQIRETLRLRKQQQIADCLAIPQSNDTGDRLDWYSPVSGKMTSWAAASDSVRSQALHHLEACQQAVAALCQHAQKAESPGQKRFGALLSKALQFPDQHFVYLVGGKPVITFWGFVSFDKKTSKDALDCLRIEPQPAAGLAKAPPPSPSPEPVTIAPPEPTPIQKAVIAPEPVPEPPLPPSATHVRITPGAVKNTLLRYGWMPPAAVLLVVLGFQLKNGIAPIDSASQSAAMTASASPPDVKTAVSVSGVSLSLPLAPAVSTSTSTLPETPPQNTAMAELRSDNDDAVPAEKDDLVMPAEAIKRGSTAFLNGIWRAQPGGKFPVTGRPPSLRYQIKNGKGTLKLTQGDGVSCRVDIYAGVMKSGNLSINSRTKARCSDGSRYQMPDLLCKQGASGPAECTGQYDANTVLPMTIKRESKS